jgi:hypothetical protein
MEAGQKEALQVEFPKERKKVHLLSEAADGLPYDIPDPNDPGAYHQEIANKIQEIIKRGFVISAIWQLILTTSCNRFIFYKVSPD